MNKDKYCQILATVHIETIGKKKTPNEMNQGLKYFEKLVPNLTFQSICIYNKKYVIMIIFDEYYDKPNYSMVYILHTLQL